jgi:glycosyltransferase involved in cell wall biosynthesis
VVSVIVPTYNTAGYIEETLDSIFAQTFRDYEVIVVNDGSPDTPELERVLLKYQNQIRYIKQENLGLSGARNTGIRNARGEFLAFPDSDDIWLPDFLADQLKFFAENPSFDMACADCVYFGDPDLEGKSWQSLDPIEGVVTLERILPTHGGAFASFVLLRREIVLKVGFFDEQLRMLEDYHYWLRLLYCGGRVAYLRKILGKRRRHSQSLTYNRDVVIPHAIKALQKFEAMLDPAGRQAYLVRREIAFAQSQLAMKEHKRRLAAGDYQGAQECLAKAQAAVNSRKVRFALLGLRWAPQWTRWAMSRWDQHWRVRIR